MLKATRIGGVLILLMFGTIATPSIMETAAAQDRADVDDDGFDDWGLLGLFGLAGLLGRKRDNVDHIRRP